MRSKNVISPTLFDMRLNKKVILHDDLDKREAEMTFLPLRCEARVRDLTENWMKLVFGTISVRK